MNIEFKENMIEKIGKTLEASKKQNPMKGSCIGIGINLKNSLSGSTVFKDNWEICKVDELTRMIEELTMLKKAIETETGLCV